MAFRNGDRVTVLGIPGAGHLVIETAKSVMPAHECLQIQLAAGTDYGRMHGGDRLAVEAWRCEAHPSDTKDFPCGPV